MDTQEMIEHAFACLAGAYPNAPLGQVNYAVATIWNSRDTDEHNVESCRYLESL